MTQIDIVKEEIRGDRKVVVIRDDANDSPAENWDLPTRFYAGQGWDNTKDDLGDGVRSAGDALRNLMDRYVDVDQVIAAIKAEKFDKLHFSYGSIIGEGETIMVADEIECPSDLYDWMYGQEVVDLINDASEEIVVKLHSFENYNERLTCVLAATKDSYRECCDEPGDGWRDDMLEKQMDLDAGNMDKWFNGEVYGFKEYALVKKHVVYQWPAWANEYGDCPEVEDVEEWEETDSLWDIYDSPDEIIENVFNDRY